MRRPVGVTASAIVAMLGSIVALMFAVLMVAALFIEPPQSQPRPQVREAIPAALAFAILAGLGFWTSAGLFRLSARARMSILVFAGFLAASSLFGLLVTTALPMPTKYSVETAQTLRQIMVAFFGIPLAIGVWWLIQFNTTSTKAAFASSPAEPASPRPLSITIIAWASILGGVSSLLAILTAGPLFLFGSIFTGWTAGVIYAFFAALTLYIGKGLLELREEARILAIGWFGFSFLHMSVVTLVPPLRRRMLDLQQTLAPGEPTPMPDSAMLMNGAFALGAIVAGGAIWFLIRNRDAFGETLKPGESATS